MWNCRYQLKLVELSTGRFGSGLCPTRNRPNRIGWQKFSLVIDRQSRRVRWIKPSMGGGWVGRRHRSEKMVRKRCEKPRFGENLIRIYVILLDSQKSHRIWWYFARSGQNLTGSTWNIAGIWVFSLEFGFVLHSSGSFGFCGEENWNWPIGVNF